MADLSNSYLDVASERAASRAIITAQDWSTWELLNKDVDEWVNTYYTSPGLLDVGSVPNLNTTAREQVADAFLRWTRGGRDLAPGADGGLPVLIGQLEPIFGPVRAKRIAVTETTRIFVEGNCAQPAAHCKASSATRLAGRFSTRRWVGLPGRRFT
ncbi:hypothetical protein [Candidatus Amarolinea dominans]|uniref:hypothetical protein n=1 Tax=Candidatus Amarolinea dominans TaxID=3140696 RepID=UPI0031360928|nr:hypothetical protein [Anaerolineae bacterium]